MEERVRANQSGLSELLQVITSDIGRKHRAGAQGKLESTEGELGIMWSKHEPSICEYSTLCHSQSLHLDFLLIHAFYCAENIL